MLAEERAENERLRQIIKELQRHRFGRRAESLPVDQLLLGLEEAEQIEAEGLAGEEATDPVKHADRVRKRRANRGSLPKHLPRIEAYLRRNLEHPALEELKAWYQAHMPKLFEAG